MHFWQSLTTILLLSYAVGSYAESLTLSECQKRVDAFVLEDSMHHAENEDRLNYLQDLAQVCPDFPQLLHNLGVLNARLQRWEKSIKLLRQSLALDTRAAHTVEMMQKLHRFQAVKAYREALQSNNPSPKPPKLELQNSDFVNYRHAEMSTTVTPDDDAQIQTLLENWWQFATSRTNECSNCFTTSLSADYFRLTNVGEFDHLSMPTATYMQVSSSYLVVLLKDKQDQHISLGLKLKPRGWHIDQIQVIP